MNRCMGFFFLLPRGVCLQLQSLEEAKNPAGNVLHLIQTCLGTTSLKKIRRVGQTISLRARIVSFSFRNSFSLVSNALKLLTQRRCGEMADATDLKSVGLKRPVPVRVRPSAVFLNCPPMRVNFLRIADLRIEDRHQPVTDMSAELERPLFIPIMLGTARRGRRTEHAARFVFEQTKKRADIETELIDVCELPIRLDDAGGHMKDPKFSATIKRSYGLSI